MSDKVYVTIDGENGVQHLIFSSATMTTTGYTGSMEFEGGYTVLKPPLVRSYISHLLDEIKDKEKEIAILKKNQAKPLDWQAVIKFMQDKRDEDAPWS